MNVISRREVETRKERRGSKSDGKGAEGKAEGKSDEPRIKKEKRNIQKVNDYVHKQLNLPRNIYG